MVDRSVNGERDIAEAGVWLWGRVDERGQQRGDEASTGPYKQSGPGTGRRGDLADDDAPDWGGPDVDEDPQRYDPPPVGRGRVELQRRGRHRHKRESGHPGAQQGGAGQAERRGTGDGGQGYGETQAGYQQVLAPRMVEEVRRRGNRLPTPRSARSTASRRCHRCRERCPWPRPGGRR
jgi:hypothetical protein